MEEFYYEHKADRGCMKVRQFIYRIGTYHYNWHQEIEILTVLNGEVEVCTEGANQTLQEDDLILVNSNQGHTTFAKAPDSIAMVLHVDPTFLKSYYDKAEFLFFQVCSVGDVKHATAFETIRRDLARMMLFNQEQKLLFEGAFYELMCTIVENFPKEELPSAAFQSNQKKLDAITGLVSYINKNYRRKISLEDLARESGYNSSYVSQLFKSYMGINFYDYLTRIRLRETIRELSHSEKKILDIALEHGFSDLKAFNSNFKENFRKTPSEYRKQLNEENCKHDLDFKKKFLSVEDELVRRKLRQYARAVNADRQNREADALKVFVRKQADLIEQLSAQLDQAAADLKQNI